MGESLLADSSEYVRAWTIQLLSESKKFSDTLLVEFAKLAKDDPSPVVRLYLASALQRIPIEKRSPILEALLAHGEDVNDHNLPLMYWYAAEPVAGKSSTAAAMLMAKSKIPLVREFLARRMSAAANATASAK